MIRSQQLLLRPTQAQRILFAKAAGLSRYAWGWAIDLCERHYAIYGKTPGYKRPTAARLMKHWNKVKDRRFPWVRESSKLIPEECFKKLDLTYRAAFARLKKGEKPGFPRKHKKGVHESFQVVPSRHHPIGAYGQYIALPRIGRVRVQTKLRWPSAAQVYGRVKFKAGRWWLSMSYDLPDTPKLPEGRPTCGVDLGCTVFATVASGGKIVDEVPPPKPYAKAKRRLRRASKAVSRKQKGSKNRKKAVQRLARVHERVANIRNDFLHKESAKLVRRYGKIKLEDLSVQGLAGGFLAKTVRDLGFAEFRRQVEYKAATAGTDVIFAERFYPSSKTCSSCGAIKDKLTLDERTWACKCGVTHNRDHNAALNLEKLPQGMGKVTPVETGGSSTRKGRGAGRRSRNATGCSTAQVERPTTKSRPRNRTA